MIVIGLFHSETLVNFKLKISPIIKKLEKFVNSQDFIHETAFSKKKRSTRKPALPQKNTGKNRNYPPAGIKGRTINWTGDQFSTGDNFLMFFRAGDNFLGNNIFCLKNWTGDNFLSKKLDGRQFFVQKTGRATKKIGRRATLNYRP